MLNLSPNRVNHLVDTNYIHSLKTLKTPRAGRILARWLVGILIILFILLFLPWQQNIQGYGTVTALNPANRPQTIETAIAGRIESWKIKEGDFVTRGDTILIISEIKEKFFDPNLLLRLREQIEAKQTSIDFKEQKADALQAQINALESGLKLKLEQAANKVKQAELKVLSDSMDFQAERVNYDVAEQQFERQQNLYDQGLKSLTELEQRKVKLQETRAKIVSAENKFLASKNELINAIIEQNSVRADYLDKISKAESELGATRADLYESTGSLAKLKNELANMEIRSEQYSIIAPQDGYIVRAIKSGIGQTIKEGEAVVTVMPKSPDVAVELYVNAMDVPLLTKGRNVRMEFDGFPAFQFSGWPNIVIGTFGGEIEVIDYVDSKGGKYRILVTPDQQERDWPEQLRIGSGVYGWVILDEVPVWYEIWRQLNGFPPSLEEEPEGNKVREVAQKS